jgi:hypothetical protein
MRTLITSSMLLLALVSTCQGSIKIINSSNIAFKPELKFITASGAKYSCNRGIPLLNQGDTTVIPAECFIWGEETAKLYQFIGIQPNEPDQLAFCPEFAPAFTHNDKLEIEFKGVNSAHPRPANGLCVVKHVR